MIVSTVSGLSCHVEQSFLADSELIKLGSLQAAKLIIVFGKLFKDTLLRVREMKRTEKVYHLVGNEPTNSRSRCV